MLHVLIRRCLSEGAEPAYSRHRRRAPGAGGRVRDDRSADDGDGHVIGVGRTAGLGGVCRRIACGRCARHSHSAASARSATTRAGRDAPRNHHTADGRSGVAGDFARRAKDCLRGYRRRPIPAIVAFARCCFGATIDGNRRRLVAVLVARWPVCWILRGWQAEAHRR